VSVEFEPVRIGSRRRGIDPFRVAAVVVVIGLVVAIAKPWEADQSAAAPGPSPTAVAAVASPSPSGSGEPGVARASRAPSAVPTSPPVPTWADVSPVIQTHETWGVRAVLAIGPNDDAGSGSASPYLDSWSPTVSDPDGTQRVTVFRDGAVVVGLGLTFPPEERPQDARIWRVHRGERLEWIDVQTIDAGMPDGAFLFARTITADPSSRSWRGGSYRIDVLVDGAVRRIDLQIPDRNSIVPEPDDWPVLERGLVGASDSNPSGVRVGLFATVEGVGVPIGVLAGRPLDEDDAWLDVVQRPTGGVAPAVGTAYLPRATGLGVMLTNHGFVHLAVLRRLAPNELAPAPPVRGGISDSQGRTPFVVFGAPDGEAMAPGVYAISVSWTDPAGLHAGTWHVELRPGPIRPKP
jgi:hypothetical protein